jgi:hypothetical protein
MMSFRCAVRIALSCDRAGGERERRKGMGGGKEKKQWTLGKKEKEGKIGALHIFCLFYACYIVRREKVYITPPMEGGLYLYLSILSPARARPAHELYWTGVGRDLEAREKNFWPESGPKCCFSCFTL